MDELTEEFAAKNFKLPDNLMAYIHAVKTDGQIVRETEEQRARQAATKVKRSYRQ